MDVKFDERSQRFVDAIKSGKKSIFLTGNAGTGKSTILRRAYENLKKEMLLLAPTGTAAINVGGSTIHRFFELGKEFSIFAIKPLNEEKKEYLQMVDCIVIDEVSMVRADLLDRIDRILRRTMMSDMPFGGIRMVFVGDPYQLPPVITEEERAYFYEFYKIPYFFGSHVWRELDIEYVKLIKVHRRTDNDFIDVLNAIRSGEFDEKHLTMLNANVKPYPMDGHRPIFLTTTNKSAENFNEKELFKINDLERAFEAEIEGNFGDDSYPTHKTVILKKGAMVMFVKNATDLSWSNGTLGTVTGLNSRIITVELFDTGKTVFVEKETWEITSPYFDVTTKKVTHEKIGIFKQFPLKLAYAITVHKSRGKTFDNVYVDLSGGTFAFGQAYVALSRGRSLKGTLLKGPIKKTDIKVDPKITAFMSGVEKMN